ncbi:RES family NAD+ phosphorylase [Actimicrobium sp. CCI2.3]|uniref:RES family NAD+ phosphorylase n=1 Tax=Actimicrobium sp. CCI2.3 TaxID=3048616 RepID=UPI002AB45A2F|nr:RES family NAD+ phosphorylase [Actimicrobium sp. CCI2.3]MDY7573718.1 RES family NAD+ phosphorylase [Actimicrobium sp. CCI2.3]MEB0021010.1 RES family NAD+ phosphorylase [Actimicrobium sp. CCI2.3]
MKLWRIAAAQWALDRRCDGTRLYGGRWNPIGFPVMYAGTTIELCALEKFVHLSGTVVPPMVLVAIDVPDHASPVFQPALSDLPDDWAALPAPASTQEIGRRWLASPEAFMMLVPSAVIPEALNAVINPAHPAYARVTLNVVREFRFDARMTDFK